MTTYAETRARWLLEQHRAGAPFESFMAAEPAADMARAYDVQDAFVAQLSQTGLKIARRRQDRADKPADAGDVRHRPSGRRVVLSQPRYRSPAAVRQFDHAALRAFVE